jgi:hypothetical protein
VAKGLLERSVVPLKFERRERVLGCEEIDVMVMVGDSLCTGNDTFE